MWGIGRRFRAPAAITHTHACNMRSLEVGVSAARSPRRAALGRILPAGMRGRGSSQCEMPARAANGPEAPAPEAHRLSTETPAAAAAAAAPPPASAGRRRREACRPICRAGGCALRMWSVMAARLRQQQTPAASTTPAAPPAPTRCSRCWGARRRGGTGNQSHSWGWRRHAARAGSSARPRRRSWAAVGCTRRGCRPRGASSSSCREWVRRQAVRRWAGLVDTEPLGSVCLPPSHPPAPTQLTPRGSHAGRQGTGVLAAAASHRVRRSTGHQAGRSWRARSGGRPGCWPPPRCPRLCGRARARSIRQCRRAAGPVGEGTAATLHTHAPAVALVGRHTVPGARQ